MEILEAFYRRKLRKKQKRSAMFHSEVDLNRAPSLASVGATATGVATGLITRVLHLTRRRDSRPHSWHSTKLAHGSCESVERVDRTSSVHASAAELLSGLDAGGGVRWSLESLEPAHTSVPPGAAHLGPRTSSSCLQLSSTSKRDSAYASLSTSSSFPECHRFGSERSFSLESVQQNVHRRPYDLPYNGQDTVKLREQPVGGACYHGASESRLLNRHSLDPIWSTGQSSCESLKGAPVPQRRSEMSKERPSSCSSLEPARSMHSLRCQQKGSWSHSSSSMPSAAKASYMAEGQLHTVIEKSPESSPISRPRQAQSSGPLQEPLWSPSHASEPNIGLRDHWNSHSHRGVEAERSFKDLSDHLDMFPSVAYVGSRPCHSAVDSQEPTPDPPSSPPQSSKPPYSDQEHPLTRLEKALAEVQDGQSTCLSVLEKVSRLEHREWATRQLSRGHRPRNDKTGPKQGGDKGTSHGAEEVRNQPERSIGGGSSTKACRTLSQERNRFLPTPTTVQWSYQELRDPPRQVFRSISLRGTRLPCGPGAPLTSPPVPQNVHSYLDKRDNKHLPLLEKTGPKTLPKPHGAASTLRPSAPAPGPLTAPPPGPLSLTRICGRKRLTWDQRKRSFSEPECMNEIGLAHTESTVLSKRAGDTSVADRRRMFEQSTVPGQEQGQRRPQSALLQPLHTAAGEQQGKYTVQSRDSVSLTSCTPEQRPLSGKGPLSSTPSPGADPHTSRSTVVYPGRVTAPLAPARQPPNLDSAVSPGKDIHCLSLSLEVDSPVQTQREDGSLSSPPGDAVEQAGRTLPGVTSEKESSALHRAADGASAPERVPSPPAHFPTPGPLVASGPRRERPRRSDCSTLAASVGLPCPLSNTTRPEHDPPSSPGQDIMAPADETETCGAKASSDQQSEAKAKHQPLKDNPPMGQKDCENGLKSWLCTEPGVGAADLLTLPGKSPSSTVPAPQLKTLPCPPDQAQDDTLALDYEPVPVRMVSPEEHRVQELLQNLVHCDRSLAPLMDVWGKSTVDVLMKIFPNNQLFGKLSQMQRDGALQDDGCQEPADVNLELNVEQKHCLTSRKVELCEALRSCIERLQQEKTSLSKELKAHTELGERVDTWVEERCEDAHTDKYRLFIGDLERVVNLLLSLCGRLARAERSLATLRKREPAEGSTELWDSLIHKRSVLLRQTQDALELREHLEQRQCTVHTLLQRSLEPPQLQHYRRLVSCTPALLITHRRLDELIQQSQEQLSLLLDAVPLEVTQAKGWSRVGLALSATALLRSHSRPPPTSRSSPARVMSRPTHLDCPVTVTSL